MVCVNMHWLPCFDVMRIQYTYCSCEVLVYTAAQHTHTVRDSIAYALFTLTREIIGRKAQEEAQHWLALAIHVNEIQFFGKRMLGNGSNCVPNGTPQSCRNERKNDEYNVPSKSVGVSLNWSCARSYCAHAFRFTFCCCSFFVLGLSVEIMLSVHLFFLCVFIRSAFWLGFFLPRFAFIACWYTFINHFNG